MILQNGVVQVIKSYVRQHARAEGSITAGFLHFESLFYASHAISLFDSHARTAWGEAEEDASLTVDMELLGKSSERRLDATTRTQLHMYVLHSDIRIAPFYAEYKAWKEGMQGEAPLATLESFHDWLRRRVDDMISLHGEDSVSRDVRNILRGPLPTATAYRHLRESGRHFRVQRRDTHRRTTDSGVYCLSVQGGTDDPPVPYAGVIRDILEVSFSSFSVVLIGARWYSVVTKDQSDHPTVVEDDCGFYRYNTRHVQHWNRPDSDVWVYPHQVDQCFFVPVVDMPRWSLAVPVFPRCQRFNFPRGNDTEVDEADL